MTRASQDSGHWLARYSDDYHAWTPITVDGRKAFTRPLGLVEWTFDTDGSEFGGRADITTLLTLEINHALPSKEAFRRRITLAWANLGLQHVNLRSRTIENEETAQRSFVIDVRRSVEEVLREAADSMVWVDDYYAEVDVQQLYQHALNTGRLINPTKCLSKIFVLPLVELPNGIFELKFVVAMAHEIADGLTTYNWFSHFIRILNMPEQEIVGEIEKCRVETSIAERLPPAQEDLYPKISGSKARQRWFWALIRVLRHVRKTLPPTFVNPLRRPQRLNEAYAFPPTFSRILDYSEAKRPPLNAGHIIAKLSQSASKRMIDLCRSIKISVGAGCFALAGIAMMEMYEARFPNVPESERLPFTSGFPLNPRAFFGFTAPADSCMLSFSEGIVMPFLPSTLPIEGRFKLTARHANRELRMYQKRVKNDEVNVSGGLETHSPGRLLADGYLYQVERLESMLPADRKTNNKPQGGLPMKAGRYRATCGVSSVGSSAAFFRPGAYDLASIGKEGGKDFAADFRTLRNAVRARENEFLVGSATDANGIVGFGVSYDLSAISEDAAEGWARKIEGLLEGGEKAKL